MPLETYDKPEAASLLDSTAERYLIFYSSIVDGVLWCPDCVAVEDLVQSTFSAPDGPHGIIVYVGDKPIWKDRSNAFRGDPFHLESIPTIIKVKDGAEVSRLVDPEITPEKLSAFVTSG